MPARAIAVLVAVLDVVLILVFAAIGRASHHEANPVVDALGTAWPFLVGAAVGWLLVYAVRRVLPLTPRLGWPVWLAAVAVGMVLRHLTGRGVAFSFVVVATIVLGVFLMGARTVVALSRRRSARASA